MPFGLAALYLLREGHKADQFWAIVLAATYPCYGMLPHFQTRPPRVLEEPWSMQVPRSRIRDFNLWILRHASIQANTVPSAHAASTMACALSLLILAPAWVGLIFLWIALSIAIGAVTGRYHYFVDVVLGCLAALAAFLIVGPLVA
jgi:membrane-associated phospholipid phosphatase